MLNVAELTRAGQRLAKLNGKHVGRPRATVNDAEILSLASVGKSMAEIGSTLGVSSATICRRMQAAEKW